MKVLHLTKTRVGGAGVAAERSVAALRAAGVAAELWTAGARPGLGPREGTLRRWLLDKLDAVPNRLHWRARRFAAWSNNWRRTELAAALNASGADVLHLHWVAQGFLALEELAALRMPVVWTMHDAWPFTGGCHYPGPCDRDERGCGACPQLGSHRAGDLSARNRRRKEAALGHVARWISPSAWLAERAARSGVVPRERLRVIANAFDAQAWTPVPRADARRALGLPDDALVCIAGSMDLGEHRKGGALLGPALDALAAGFTRPVVGLLFGSGRLPHTPAGWTPRYLGRVADPAELNRCYSVADVALMPSLQDNLPWFAIEAHASGCPVVGFDSGGLREIVRDEVTGRIATGMSAVALAAAARRWIDAARPRELTAMACVAAVRSLCDPAAHATALMREYAAVMAERMRR